MPTAQKAAPGPRDDAQSGQQRGLLRVSEVVGRGFSGAIRRLTVKTLVRLVVCAALIAAAAPARAADAITGVLNPYFRIQSALADDRIDTLKTDCCS